MSKSDQKRVSYGNFRNPLGLVARMLRSGNRAAYSALFREGLRLTVIPLDIVLSLFEPSGQSNLERKQPLILIVGPPRAGTTLVYQVLSRCLNVSYASNLIAMFPRAPIIASKLFRPSSQRSSARFSNFYGQTSGISGPNDAFPIWNRWLGSDRYVPAADLDEKSKEDMRRFFANWSRQHAAPFLNKNNRNTACIRVLSECLPKTWFVVVRRDLSATVRSLIRAREQVQGNKRHRWGLLSTEETNEDELGYVDDVCSQVVSVDRCLTEQLRSIDQSRVLEVSYEDFCSKPEALLKRLIESMPGLTLADVACPDSFNKSTAPPLSEKEEERIRNCIDHLTVASG